MRELKNYDETENNSYGFISGILMGAAVGAAVALLLAPKTGVDMRQQISATTGKLRRKAMDGYGVAADTVSHMVDDVVTRGKQAVQNGQQTYDNVLNAADDASQAASRSMKSAPRA